MKFKFLTLAGVLTLLAMSCPKETKLAWYLPKLPF